MKITRRFTRPGQDALSSVEYEKRTSRITNPDGSVVFEMHDAEIPRQWSQLATDIMVSKYFRKAGIPLLDEAGQPIKDAAGKPVTGPEKSARQVVHRLAGCWRHWGETHGYFDSAEDAQAFYDEIAYMLLHQMCAPNSPQWFNTGLNWAYGITGPAQGHFYCDPKTGELRKSADAYSHPQPHACQPYKAPVSTPSGPVPIGMIVHENLVGLEVYDGTDNGSGTTRVIAVKANGEKSVYRVILDGGVIVEATADHLIYVRASDGLGGRWVRLDCLERGMKLLRSVRDKDAEQYLARSTDASTSEIATLVPLRKLQELAIKRIESLGVLPVYDIQTASGQYLSNGVIVHNCFIQSVSDDLVNDGGIMDLWTREARLFKFGSGTGTNFSGLRGENEPLSGGGKSSGLMSFLKIGDRAAGAIKSGGTTRRAAKMVCLDLDHPDIELFVNWKVREELKVAAMAEGIKVLPKDQQAIAKKLNLKLDYDFNGEAYYTVSGQNSNNSVRIRNDFFKAVEKDGTWNLTRRTDGKISKTLKARDLWEQIAFAAWRCADPGVQFDDTINQWHTCPRSGRINASNPCVTGDTRVLTPGGIWRRIDQMIHLPTRVVTNLNHQEVHNTEGAFPTGVKETYELRTAGGYTLHLTEDHKLWTRHRGWIAARDLTPADEVKLPSRPATAREVGEPQDAQLFHLAGLLLSSANDDSHAVHLDRCLRDADQIDNLAHYAAENWAQGTLAERYDDDYVNSAMLEGDGSHTLTLTLTNRRLLSRLGAFIRSTSTGRRLSDEAFTSGLAAQKHLLRALFTADAAIGRDSLTLPSSTTALLEDVQLLLLGFGVKSTITDSGLRIESHNLRAFGKHIGLLPGEKLESLAAAIGRAIEASPHYLTAENWDHIATLAPLGQQPVYDLTEPATSSFVANGITVHNCSEYMFLDDTACNLASLNVLTFFDSESRRFHTEDYKHAIRLWTIVLEISVLMASFPSESIARLSYRFRTLGLGYANLGAMLMQAGIPYDSDKGRAICAALTAILTGESYATSADLAREHGPFSGYHENRGDMLHVIRNHRRAAYDPQHNLKVRQGLGDYEALDIKPVPIDEAQFADADTLASRPLLGAARECWDRALSLGERFGFRNAQTTVIAPTGTIGLLMDCDTTGVEPDFALVKFKKLAGGGYFKIANQSLAPALQALGYDSTQVHEILSFVLGSLSFENSPHVNRISLRAAGLTDGEIDSIEASLPSVFELSFAFNPYSLSADTLNRLGITREESQTPGFNLLQRLGFSRAQVDEANDHIVGRGTVEGAPHLRPEHLPVFDCANKCGKHGQRFIPVTGHIRMMAAAQPFISGAISKTINLPNEATVDDIKQSYWLSWTLGLKANALYRDGSKLSQPLNVKSDEELDKKTDDEDEDAIEAAREEVAAEVAVAADSIANRKSQIANPKSDNLSPTTTAPIEKIIERIVERPLRRRLPDTRSARTHKFDVQGHEGYITVGLYDDGAPGEVFITMAKEGSTIGGLMDTIATLVSVALQYGVPVESLVRKFEHVRFEPSGMTRNPEIPFAKSIVDYIFRWLAMEFIPGYRAANAPQKKNKPAASPASTDSKPAAAWVAPAPQIPSAPAGEAVAPLPGPAASAPLNELSTQHSAPSADLHQIRKNANGNGNGNGHGHRDDDDSRAADGPALELHPKLDPAASSGGPASPANVKLIVAADPLSQQGAEMQADAPACDVCGSITVRSGTCYKCLNCGNSMGCS